MLILLLNVQRVIFLIFMGIALFSILFWVADMIIQGSSISFISSSITMMAIFYFIWAGIGILYFKFNYKKISNKKISFKDFISFKFDISKD